MVPSWKIANLLSNQISTPAIAREVYGYGTKPENCEFAELSTLAVARGVRVWY